MWRKGFEEQTWFTFSYSPVRDESGKTSGVFCACTETTAQVLAERSRIAESDRLRQLFHEAPGFMCVLRGPTHVFDLVNSAYSQLVGHRDVEGKSVLEALPEVSGQGFIELLDRVYQTGQPFIGRHMPFKVQRHPGADLETRFIDLIYQPISDPVGTVTGIFVEGSDVTEAHLIHEQLRQSRDHLARETRALEVLNRVGTELAAELDVDALVQGVVDAGVELTGAQFGAFFYNVHAATGERMLLYVLSGADKSAFESFGMPRATSVFAPTFRGEGIFRSADITSDPRYGKNAPHSGMPKGHLPVRSYLAVPVTSRSGEVIGGLFFGHEMPGVFDERVEQVISALAAQAAIGVDNARLFQAVQRNNENLEQRIDERTKELNQAHEALRQSQKMEAVGQLTGGIAHDFNNLLQGIVGSLDIVQKRISQGRTGELERFVSGAMTSANRAAALTHRLLAFSRRQPLDPKPVKANPLVASMEDLLRRTMGERIEIELVLAGGLWTTLCDQNQLESAILNLAINARDAMPDGGKLTIETCNAHLDSAYAAKTREVAPGQYICICVTDTGSGMTADVIERAFDPFFTTKPIGQGPGSVCR
jgi:signal transduction histidine kinase